MMIPNIGINFNKAAKTHANCFGSEAGVPSERHSVAFGNYWFLHDAEGAPLATMEFLLKKPYARSGYRYLLLTDFGESMQFWPEEHLKCQDQ